MTRLTKTEYFFKVVEAIAALATCNRGKSGAVLVKNNRVIATGYVGAAAGDLHCDDVGHAIEIRTLKSYSNEISEHCSRTVHAELNTILSAARYGPSTEGATLYCTMFPCYECAKAIVNSGIKKVHAARDYHKSKRSKILFDKIGIEWTIENEKVAVYDEQDKE